MGCVPGLWTHAIRATLGVCSEMVREGDAFLRLDVLVQSIAL